MIRVAITSPNFVALLLVSEIAKYNTMPPMPILPEAMYCCFTRTTLFTYYNVYCYCCDVFIEKYVYTKFRLVVSVSYMIIYVPIVMYGLRLFIVVLQELHCLPNCLHISMIKVIGFYHFTKFCLHLQVFEIAKCIA